MPLKLVLKPSRDIFHPKYQGFYYCQKLDYLPFQDHSVMLFTNRRKILILLLKIYN